MTKHTILMPVRAISQDLGIPSMSQDDFSDKLAPLAAPRPTGVSLFRGRSLPAIHTPAPLPARLPAAAAIDHPPPELARPNPARNWESLSKVALDRDLLAGNGLFVDDEQHEITAQFDILRTRMLQVMSERGWKRVAVTSPTHGCGKSLVAANLALSLARVPSCRCLLIDLELRHPDLGRLMGLHGGSLADMLTGEQPVEAHLRRFRHNLALALNGEPVAAPAATLLDPRLDDTLRNLQQTLEPTVTVIDMPHALGNDDVIAMLPRLDAVLLVADATRTTGTDIRSCERLFEGRVPLLGVVLNRARETSLRRYRYRKG